MHILEDKRTLSLFTLLSFLLLLGNKKDTGLQNPCCVCRCYNQWHTLMYLPFCSQHLQFLLCEDLIPYLLVTCLGS